jgi:hypothetical protein
MQRNAAAVGSGRCPSWKRAFFQAWPGNEFRNENCKLMAARLAAAEHRRPLL